MQYFTHNVQETMDLGESLAPFLRPSDVILLDGDLGAGKTHFVKGLAKGLGYTGDVVSPTFTILNVYPLMDPKTSMENLYHWDVYRVSEEEEILMQGFEEIIYSDNVSVIEWSDLIVGILPQDYLKITIETTPVKDERRITMTFSPDQRNREVPTC